MRPTDVGKYSHNETEKWCSLPMVTNTLPINVLKEASELDELRRPE